MTDDDVVSPPDARTKVIVVVGSWEVSLRVNLPWCTQWYCELRQSCWTCPSSVVSVCVEIFWNLKKKKSVSVPYVYTGRGPVSSPALHIFPLCNRKQTYLSLVGFGLSNNTNSKRCDLAHLKYDVEVSPPVSALWAVETQHSCRFAAGKHVRVILTSATTYCVHAVFGVYTKYIKKGVSPYHVKINPRLSLVLGENTRAQKCCCSGLLSECEHHLSKDWPLIDSWYMAAFYCIL